MLSGVRRAIGYAVQALRLLRRHPSFLLFALAMAVVGAVDGRVGTYLAYAHTGWGQDHQDMMASGEAARANSGRPFTFSAKPFGYMMFVTPPIPGLDFNGATQLLWALAYGSAGKLAPPDPDRGYRAPERWGVFHMLLSPLVTLLLPLILGSFVSAGYLTTARNTVTGGTPRWSAFFAEARRFYVRLTLFMLLWLAAFMPLGVITALRGGNSTHFYAALPILFLLSLTNFAIVADDIGVFAGIRRSVTTVIRDSPIALVLILGTGLLARAAALLSPWLANPQAVRVTDNPIPILPLEVLSWCLMYALGAWFTLAAFLWYGESRQSAAPAHDLLEKGGSDESYPSRDICPAP